MATRAKAGSATTDAATILRRRYVDGQPEAEALLAEVQAEAELARAVFRLRTGAGLTQRQLAARVGTSASVISRLESADYTGHSLAILRRIAAAVGRRVEVRFPKATGPSAKGTRRPGPKAATPRSSS